MAQPSDITAPNPICNSYFEDLKIIFHPRNKSISPYAPRWIAMKFVTINYKEAKISSYLQGALYSATKNMADYFNEKYIPDDNFSKEVKIMPIGAFRTIIDDYIDGEAAEGIAEAAEKATEKAEEKAAKTVAGHIKGKIQEVVKVVKKWRCPLTEAMDDMELEPQYRANVIEELEKLGISYSD